MKNLLIVTMLLLGACSAIVDGKEEEDGGLDSSWDTSSDSWDSTDPDGTSTGTDQETETGEPSTETDSESGDNTDSESTTESSTDETTDSNTGDTGEDTEVDTEQECNDAEQMWCDEETNTTFLCNRYTWEWEERDWCKPEQRCQNTPTELLCYQPDPPEELIQGEDHAYSSCKFRYVCWGGKHIYECEQIAQNEVSLTLVDSCEYKCQADTTAPDPSYFCIE